ncbi:MAG: pyridoxal phosphate-dependent aminotransferase, partial [Acidobacteria bacterium]|nr:pyridoxal phosphate-dependent aminotransferase [Acidobacteriota bacterium]
MGKGIRAGFSRRLRWGAPQNRLARAVEARRRAGLPLLDLTESNPTRAGLRYPAELLGPLADPRSLVYEPAPAGLPEAREAIASWYLARGLRVEATSILVTASTSEAYGFLFKLLADPGDEVLVPRPSYPLFEFLAALEGLRFSQYRLVYDGRWSVDFDALARAIGPRTRVVVAVNPNNPTGSFLTEAETAKLQSLCAARGLALISDEVFSDYGFAECAGGRVRSLAGGSEALTFCLGGLSKAAGLPQMKLAWMAIGGPAAEARRAREALELIADTYLSVSTPVQHALVRLLEAGGYVRRQIAERTAANLAWLKAAGTKLLEPEGGWYVILPGPSGRSEE